MKKFEEICLLVIDDIKSGRKKVGDKIPSIRAMAEKHKVSKNTVVNAYNIWWCVRKYAEEIKGG